MGCAGSKLDDLEAVALCRYRSEKLEKAILHRYALADAHASYIQCLRDLGVSLHKFFLLTDLTSPSSPRLTLPSQRKGDPPPPLHRSHSGSHLHFHDSEGDSDDDDAPLHSDHSSPLPHHLDEFETVTTTKTYSNFAKKGPPPPSVTFEQRPEAQVASFGGDPGPSGSYYGDSYAPSNPNYNAGGYTGYGYSYPAPGGYGYPYQSGYGGGGGFFGSASPPAMPSPPPAASPPRAPPPPPSPPRSTWDFLNPFEGYDSYQHAYTPSRSSRELREEEGIPDLEDEEQEVVKEAYGDSKFSGGASTSGAGGGGGEEVHSSKKAVAVEEDGRKSGGDELHYEARVSGARESEVRLTEKSIVVDEVLQHEKQRKLVPRSRSATEAVHEIKSQFDRASDSLEEASRMLEVGKLPYHRKKHLVVSSKMRYAITPSTSSATTSQTSRTKTSEQSDTTSSMHLDFNEEKGLKAGNLSSTLQKLYIWEKKLLEEVRAEEKMRLCYDRNCKRLKHLDDKGAEAQKIESTRVLVLELSTKLRIAIQVVNSISERINKLRDQELWPELDELIQGLVTMWQVLNECHRSQCEAVIEANGLDSVATAFAGKLSDAHMKATVQFVLKLLKWIEIFSSWVDSQRSYIKSLNFWLMKCLPVEPEVTDDGIAPFSPGRIGAPPVFVICNHWSQIMDKVSEQEVVEAMRSFTTTVLQVWQESYQGMRSRLLGNRDMDRQLKSLERDDQEIHRAVDAINRRQAQVAGQLIRVGLSAESNGLQRSLQQFFEAMERFSESSLKAYKELHMRCQEEKTARENGSAS